MLRQVGRTSTVSPGSHTWFPVVSTSSAVGRRPPNRWAKTPGPLPSRKLVGPDGDHVAHVVGGDGRFGLDVGGVAVHGVLGIARRAREGEPAANDAVVAPVEAVVPVDDEVAAPVHAEGVRVLVGGGDRVHLELGAHRGRGGVEAAGEHLTVGAGVGPDHGELAVGVHAHGGRLLGPGGVRGHRNSPPTLLPLASKRWPKSPKSSPSYDVQITTKVLSSRMAMEGPNWKPVV